MGVQPFPFHRNYTSLNLNRASRIGDPYLDAGQVYLTLMLDMWFLPWCWTGVSYLDAGQVFGRSDDVSAQVQLVHASEGDDVDLGDVISCYLRKTHTYTKTSASRSLHLVLNLLSSLKARQKNWNACFYSCRIWFCKVYVQGAGSSMNSSCGSTVIQNFQDRQISALPLFPLKKFPHCSSISAVFPQLFPQAKNINLIRYN